MNNSIILKFSITFLAVFSFTVSNAQVLTNNGQSPIIRGSNVLLDGSTNFSTESGAGNYIGKGIIIPSVDLVNFSFDLSLVDGSTFPTYFDGMIVYNNSTGTTLITGNRSSIATFVTPGYYYFSNPNGAANSSITQGEWKSIGGGDTSSIKKIVSNLSLNDSHSVIQADATSADITITLPDPSTVSGRKYTICKVDKSINKLIFTRTILGSEFSFNQVNVPGSYNIQSDGTDWFLIK